MRFLRTFVLACAVVFVWQTSSPADAISRHTDTAAKIKVSTAKLRAKPSETGRTKGLLDHDVTVTVIGSKSGWLQVVTKRGTTGWIRRDLVAVSRTHKVARTPTPRVKTAQHKVIPQKQVAQSKPVAQVKKVEARRSSVAKSTTNVTVVSPETSNGHLPDIVKTDSTNTEGSIQIIDPIASKRSSIVELAQDVVNASKSASPVRSTLMSRANSQRGTPYRYGSSGGGTFDCSGFTSAMFRKIGVRLPRTAAEQFHVGQHITKASLTKGDLVFFRNTAGRRGISHVGIYSGNGKFIHASSRGHSVRIDTLSHGYYANHFAGGRRLIR